MFVKLRRTPAAVRSDDSGAAAIELALVSPIMVMLLIGAIQVGWVLHCAASVRWALESASRSLMIDSTLTEDDLRAAVIEKLSGVGDDDNLTVTITPDDDAKTLIVQSRYEASLAVPFVPKDTLTFKETITVPNFD